MDTATKHQIEIAKKTLRMPDAMAKVMGGMTKEEARELLKKYRIKFNESKNLIEKYIGEGWPDHESIWGKPKRSDYKDLGYSNGWGKIPDIVEKCEKKHHKLSAVKVDRGVTEYFCDICKYKYRIDSTD